MSLTNTFVGLDAGADPAQKSDAENSTALGAGSYTTKDDQVVLGGPAVTETVLRGVVLGSTFAASALPSASAAGAGARAFVTDATAATFASVVAGGGANGVPVYSDGTDWRVG